MRPEQNRPVLTPTQSRQASPRRTNLRVLIVSMALALVTGTVLVSSVWKATPPSMDASPGKPTSPPASNAPAEPTSKPASPPVSPTQPERP
jgi:hypothetical protein